MGYTLHTYSTAGSSTFNLSNYDFNTRLATTLTSGISGTGNFIYSGLGLLVLSADSTYVGNTSITGGTLQVGDGGTTGSLGTGNITVTSPGMLVFNRSNSYTLPGTISGTGTVEQAGSGTLDLNGGSHSAGLWILENGTISNGTLAGNFSLHSGTIPAVLADSGAVTTVTKSTPGTVVLSGTNTYSGATAISAGTLLVNGNSSGATGAVTVASGATLGGNGTVGGAVTAQTGSTLNAGNGVGTLTTAGNVTLAAGSNLNWQIKDATGSAGTTGWDLLAIGGALDITATSQNPVKINLWSVLANGSNGPVANFNPTLSAYSWKLATATGGITCGGSPCSGIGNYFQINTAPTNGTGGLISPYSVNGFTVSVSGNDLMLNYSPPIAQTLNGTNNGTEATSYTTQTSANSLTLNLGFFTDYLIIGGGGGGGANSAAGGWIVW